jgi:hypothetical protein
VNIGGATTSISNFEQDSRLASLFAGDLVPDRIIREQGGVGLSPDLTRCAAAV